MASVEGLERLIENRGENAGPPLPVVVAGLVRHLLNRSRIEFVRAGLLRENDKVITLGYEAGYQNVG